MPKTSNIQRFGKLGRPMVDDKDIIIEANDYCIKIRLDYDDVDHAKVRAFAKALVKLWNSQPNP